MLYRCAATLAVAITWWGAWSTNLFLVTALLPAAGLTFVMDARARDRLGARRAAALAVTAAVGDLDPTTLERMTAADIAATSMGDTRVIARTTEAARVTVADPWRRELALERLELALRLLSPRSFLGGTDGARWSWILPCSFAAVLTFTAAVALTGHRLAVTALAAAVSMFAVALANRRRIAQLAPVLVHAATADPADRAVNVSETAVVDAIRSIVGGSPRGLATAAAMVRRCPHGQQEVAKRRLQAAGADVDHRRWTAEHQVLACTLAAAILTALMETR